MARRKNGRSSHPEPSGADPAKAGLDLTRPIHARISPAAEVLLHEKARAAGLPPATWVRLELYKALGLIKE